MVSTVASVSLALCGARSLSSTLKYLSSFRQHLANNTLSRAADVRCHLRTMFYGLVLVPHYSRQIRIYFFLAIETA